MMDKLPAAPDAERGLLCCMMLSPDKVIGEFLERQGGEEYFHHHQNLVIYRQLVRMWQDKTHIDITTVTQALEDSGALEQVGGPGYIAEVSIFIPSARPAKGYADILREKLIARETIDLADRMKTAAMEGSKGLEEIVQTGLIKFASRFDTTSQTHSMPKLMAQVLDELEEQATGGVVPGILTGLQTLDNTMMGMQPGDMVVLAAHRKGGKSAFALQVARHNVLQGIPVVMFSFEMTAKQIAKRLLSSDSSVNMGDVVRGLSEQQLRQLSASVHKLSGVPLFIRDESVMTPLQLRAAARKMHAEHKCKLMIIDYLQLLEPSAGSSKHNREQQVAEFSRTIKLLAMELKIPIMALSQRNSDGATRESRAPENDCNVLLAIEEDALGEYAIDIRAARDCGNAKISVEFQKEFIRFVEAQ